MSQKRIHKTLEEVEAENGFVMAQADAPENTPAFDQYEEHDQDFVDDMEHAEVDEYVDVEDEQENWDEAQETFDEIASVAEELLTPEEEPQVQAAEAPKTPMSNHEVVTTAAPKLTLLAGGLLVIVGFVLSVFAMLNPTAGTAMITNLQKCGLTPGLLVVGGVVLLTIVTVVRRHHESVQAQLQMCLDDNVANAERLEYLVEAQRMNLSRRPASGEELEQVLHSLSRQDEKINNVTRALKMYGKPLVDVNRLATENGQKSKAIAAQLTDVRESVESLGEKMLDPMGEMLTRASRENTDEVTTRLDVIEDKLGEAMLAPIADMVTRLTREGTESVTSSLDTMLNRTSRESLDEMMKAVEILCEQVTSDISKTMSELPTGDTPDTGEFVQAVRTEFKDIRDTLGQIQLDATKIASNPAPAATIASTPTPTAAPSAAPPAAAPPAAAPQSMGNAPQGEGPAQKISGSAKTSGKAVLGAIAKLRKMR